MGGPYPIIVRRSKAKQEKEKSEIIVKSDSMDANGVRQITLQTTATGNNPEGYKAAERQAHQWFFVNYDGSARMRLLTGQSPTSIIDKAI